MPEQRGERAADNKVTLSSIIMHFTPSRRGVATDGKLPPCICLFPAHCRLAHSYSFRFFDAVPSRKAARRKTEQ